MKVRLIALCMAGALASAGALMAYQSTLPIVQSVAINTSEPRHPVTEAMRSETENQKLKTAPAYALVDSEGKDVVVGGPAEARPQFLYFVKDGCPCSVEVEPLFHDMSKRYKGKVDFVAVINTGLPEAKAWHTEKLTPYSMVPDPKMEIIKSYGATNSAFSCLVSRDGKIVKMWPGYSVDLMDDMYAKLAAEVGEKAKPYDHKWLPKRQTSGCEFDEGPLPGDPTAGGAPGDTSPTP